MWQKIVFFSVMASGCTIQPTTFSVPEQIDFNGQRYQKTTDTTLAQMRQLLYLPNTRDQNPDDWQQGFLLFLDHDLKGKTLTDRATLRKNAYQKQPNTQANIAIIGDELRTEVLYPPTERFNDYQLEVSRGKQFSCGFGQMQFSDKRSISTKKQQNLTAYQQALTQFAQQLATLSWQMECKK